MFVKWKHKIGKTCKCMFINIIYTGFSNTDKMRIGSSKNLYHKGCATMMKGYAIK